MQPFLQYRRIRQQVKEQLARQKEKTVKADTGSGSNSDQPAFDQDASEKDTPDLEKGSSGKDFASRPRKEQETAVSDGEKDAQDSRESLESVESFEERQEDTQDAHAINTGADPNQSRRLSRQSTRSQRTIGTSLGLSLTGIDVRDRTTNEGGDRQKQVFVVDFENDNDQTNPHNWSKWKKTKVTMLVASVGIIVGIASAIDSSVLMVAAKDLHVSEVAESLATGIYLIGFGVGALFAAPFSETFGRNIVYIATMVLFMIWIMASGLSPNFGAQMVFRFLAGFFGSTPLVCAGGSLADIWSPLERTYTFPIFANAAFTGPVLGPVMGGWIAQAAGEGKISWRWTEWTTLIGAGGVLFGLVVAMPETFAPLLLHWKAKHLRELTNDNRFASPMEVKQESFWTRMKRSLSRPFVMATEPIILLISMYLSVIYIILFTFLDGYDYIFGQIHGTSEGITGLCFLGIVVGLMGGTGIVWPVWKLSLRDLRRAQAKGFQGLQPESRLWYSMLGGSIAIPVSLFWMGWTSYPDISIWSPLAASVLFGYGILTVFISSYQYIIDSYEVYSASALSFATLIRYIASGGMVVVGVPFYENLGVHYTLTILACISAVLTPLPYVFYVYGPKIRKMSKYAVDQK